MQRLVTGRRDSQDRDVCLCGIIYRRESEVRENARSDAMQIDLATGWRERQQVALILQQHQRASLRIQRSDLELARSNHLRGRCRIHVGVLEQPETELQLEDAQHGLIEPRFADTSTAHRLHEHRVRPRRRRTDRVLPRRPLRIARPSMPLDTPRHADAGRYLLRRARSQQLESQSFVMDQSESTMPLKPAESCAAARVSSWRLKPAPTGSSGLPFTVTPRSTLYVGMTAAGASGTPPRRGGCDRRSACRESSNIDRSSCDRRSRARPRRTPPSASPPWRRPTVPGRSRSAGSPRRTRATMRLTSSGSSPNVPSMRGQRGSVPRSACGDSAMWMPTARYSRRAISANRRTRRVADAGEPSAWAIARSRSPRRPHPACRRSGCGDPS